MQLGTGAAGGAIPIQCSAPASPLRRTDNVSNVQIRISFLGWQSKQWDAAAQGWQLLEPRETSFFAVVNLPLLDFTSRTGPEADFDSGNGHSATFPPSLS